MKVDRDIEHLQPAFRDKVKTWLAKMKEAGIEIRITETLRSYERQAELYAQGRTAKGQVVTNARAGQSNHHWGLALDAYPVVNGKVVVNFDKDAKALAVMKKAAEIAASLGIHWGIAKKGQPVKDMPHFQAEDLPHWTEAQKKWPGGWRP